MKDYIRHIPEGVRDVLGEEAVKKRWIEERIRAVFKSYDYSFLETPTFEYLDVFTLGNESYQNKDLYTWVNREGEIVALRSDQTRAIARVVATSHHTFNYPSRYAYLSPTFRHLKQYQGKMHEFTQAGVELMGVDTIQSDAEVIVLAVEALKACDISDFTIHIASATFLYEMLETLGLTKTVKESIQQAIKRKDAVSIRQLLKKCKGAEEVSTLLIELLQGSGTMGLLEEIKAKVTHPSIQSALNHLEALYKQLTYFGVANHVLFDFSILSYASYYTGMMFQAYTEGVGEAIAEGGRYDTLLQNFGVDVPAVGMGINVNLLLQKYEANQKKIQESKRILVGWEDGSALEGIAQAMELREQGYIVAYALNNDYESQVAYMQRTNMEKLIFIKADRQVCCVEKEV